MLHEVWLQRKEDLSTREMSDNENRDRDGERGRDRDRDDREERTERRGAID